jgi:hypothetical protein
MGAGFSLAMRDLEIRGAGNLLGTQQSGHIATVGYELYCRLLEQAVRGMNDILPDQAQWWERFEDTVRDWLHAYGYRNIRMPVLERTDLFVRSIGEVTDIVEKEMYTFVDQMNGESLTLRPEGTASCVRAAIEHNLLYPGPQRLCYSGPMFRHERPQKGRYRQFHQVGVEALGYVGPDIDAEHIVMCARLWRALGIGDVALELNTLGDSESRGRFRERLVKYFERHAAVLDADSQRRLQTNPLRILDSKNPQMQELIAAARKRPGDMTYGTSGSGSVGNMIGELLSQRAAIKPGMRCKGKRTTRISNTPKMIRSRPGILPMSSLVPSLSPCRISAPISGPKTVPAPPIMGASSASTEIQVPKAILLSI